MENQQTHTTNPLYSSMLRDASPKDLVHVLVRRLTRIREVHAARTAITEPIAISDASISEILIMLQKQMQDMRHRRFDGDEFLVRVETSCEQAMQAGNLHAAHEAMQVIQEEIRKVRQRGK
jgi:hypothetical protein